MTVKSAPYYWLVCDAPGCGASSTEGGDFSAYSDLNGAQISATDEREWKITDDGRHYCDDHANNVCEECGAYDDTRYSGERDYLCVPCAAEQGIHQCPSCGMSDDMHDRTCTAETTKETTTQETTKP